MTPKKSPDSAQAELLPRHPSYRRKSDAVAQIAEQLAVDQQTNSRTDALVFARSIALASLPKKPTRATSLQRDLRLGKDLWLRVSYNTRGKRLPYGADRFVLAAIQHLAILQDSPVVYFDRVGALLEMFGLDEGGQKLNRLRARFERISDLLISLVFASSQEELDEKPRTDTILVVRRTSLPTRAEMAASRGGDDQLMLPLLPADKDGEVHPFGVQLSTDFWEMLKEQREQLIVPVELLKLFLDAPTGWDYLCFLVARCGRAQSHSVIDHNILMGLFKEGDEPDRNTIARIQRYHDLIMQATRGSLNASIEEAGHFPKKKGQRGRPRKRWVLKVGPSRKIVSSGKKSLPGGSVN